MTGRLHSGPARRAGAAAPGRLTVRRHFLLPAAAAAVGLGGARVAAEAILAWWDAGDAPALTARASAR
jgi:hypothetical protein